MSRPRSTEAPKRCEYLQHSVDLMKMGENPVKLTEPSQVRKRTVEYLSLCDQQNMTPTIPGLALALGSTAGEMARCPSGDLVRACQAIESMSAQMAQDGHIPMAIYIFQAKNWFGYKDQSEVKVIGDVSVSKTPEEVEARYAKASLVETDAAPALPEGGSRRRRGRRRAD